MLCRRMLAVVGAAAGFLGIAGMAQAEPGFPTRPVTLIVPWAAGGSADVVLRAMADVAGKALGQPVIVDNKAGAAGTLGPATMAATAKPDGYTISQIAVTVHRYPLMQKTTWDSLRDFSYIIHVSGFTFGITARADGPFKDWRDVVAFAKANPGKVSYGTPGVGTSQHLGMEQIAAHEGIQLTHVPFKGTAESSAAIAGGHVTLQADSSGWKPLVDGGIVRLLAIWTESRSRNWPATPTLKELGLPFVFDSPMGLAGPKGIDPAIIKKLHDAFKTALDDPGVIALLAKYDMAPHYMDSAAYARFVGQYIASERKVVEKLGLLRKD